METPEIAGQLTKGARLSDNLRLERELGSGAMGTVWVAHNLSLGADVAVKVLSRGVGQSEARRRFEQEARAAARLDSPHIVHIYDYGVTGDDQPYIVMELLRGEDLRTHIEERGPLSPQLTAHLIGQMCRGLSKAHAQKIIHRDIKPANVFIIDNDGEPFVKLLDFGVAKHGAENDLGMTETGAMMGTPYYMSPEQLLDPSRVDVRTDLWAVGVVTYACLTRTLPFQGETLGALSVAIHEAKYAAPSELRPELPAALDAWVKRALAKAPDDRFQTAQELAAALEVAAASAPSGRPSSGTGAAIITTSDAPPTAEERVATGHATSLGEETKADEANARLFVAETVAQAPAHLARSSMPEIGGSAMATVPVTALNATSLNASTNTAWVGGRPRRGIRSWLGIAVAMAAVGLLGWWLGRSPAGVATPGADATTAASSTTPPPTAMSGDTTPPNAEPTARDDEHPSPPQPGASATTAPTATMAPIATTAPTAKTAPTARLPRSRRPPLSGRPPSATAPAASSSPPSWDQPFYPPSPAPPKNK